MFPKNSAFDPEWGKTGPGTPDGPPVSPTLATAEGQRASAQQKLGVVEIPRRDLEDIIAVIRLAAFELENDNAFLAEEVADQVDRLTSYFKG